MSKRKTVQVAVIDEQVKRYEQFMSKRADMSKEAIASAVQKYRERVERGQASAAH